MRSSSDPCIVRVIAVIVVGDEEVGRGTGVNAVAVRQSDVVVVVEVIGVAAVLLFVTERRGRKIRASSSPCRGF